ncbi:hypothetical protein ACXR2T_10575 [Leucobacter sp. HY1910]
MSANSVVIGSAVQGVSYASPTAAGFDIVVRRTDTVGTGVSWTATLS